MRLVFVDCETTGLDPLRHEIWEVAIFDPERESFQIVQRVPWHLDMADAEALIVNGFYERRARAASERRLGIPVAVELLDDDRWALRVAGALSGSSLAGIGPWFDSEMLKYQLRRLGHAPAWDHRLVDCKALAVGYIRVASKTGYSNSGFGGVDVDTLIRLMEPPFSTADVAEVLKIDRGDTHTSYADVVTAVRFYERAMGVEFSLPGVL